MFWRFRDSANPPRTLSPTSSLVAEAASLKRYLLDASLCRRTQILSRISWQQSRFVADLFFIPEAIAGCKLRHSSFLRFSGLIRLEPHEYWFLFTRKSLRRCQDHRPLQRLRGRFHTIPTKRSQPRLPRGRLKPAQTFTLGLRRRLRPRLKPIAPFGSPAQLCESLEREDGLKSAA